MGMVRSSPVNACIALGSNVGDRLNSIELAMQALGQLGEVVARSTIVETEPVGPVSQGPFLNAAAVVATRLEAKQLLLSLLEIERRLGRDRKNAPRWGPRVIDLDLILYGEDVVVEEGLTVPHPRMHERMFVLGPLAEVAGRMRVPTLNATVAELRDRLAAAGTLRTVGGSN